MHWWPFTQTTSSDLNATRNEKTDNPTPRNNNPPTKQDLSTNPTNGQTSNEVPVNHDFVASITQLEETNNQITFKATVQNAPAAGGTCVVTFSNPNDRPVTKQFAPTGSSTSAVCGPLTLPATEFSYLGTWQVDFHYYSGDQQATANNTIIIR